MGTITDSDHESGDLESLVYGPLDEQDSIIQDIMSRREGDEFPEVLLEQASSDSIENLDINCLLEWLQHTDHAKMKKYMNDRYHDSQWGRPIARIICYGTRQVGEKLVLCSCV